MYTYLQLSSTVTIHQIWYGSDTIDVLEAQRKLSRELDLP